MRRRCLRSAPFRLGGPLSGSETRPGGLATPVWLHAGLHSASVEPLARSRCSTGVKALGAVGLVALVVCATASAKFSIAIAASDKTPTVGQRVTLVVGSNQALGYDLRLIAVAPGQPVFRVVATITGDTGRPIPNVQSRGFEIDLTRAGPNRWRGVARFARPGRWRVVVPNGAPVGVVVPNGVAMLALAVR